MIRPHRFEIAATRPVDWIGPVVEAEVEAGG
jgi:hypothetical protein